MKAKQKDVLRFINDLDKQGKNLKKEELLEKMNHIDDASFHYNQLLLIGEIFEIGNVVFPLTTMNDRDFNHG